MKPSDVLREILEDTNIWIKNNNQQNFCDQTTIISNNK